jgi:plastocyanin
MVQDVRYRSLVWLLAALAAAAVGAGPPATAAARKPATHTVTIEGSRFEPSVLTVRTGDAILWVNKDVFPHTATSQAGGFDSLSIAAGKSWRYTAGQAGEFAYTCTFHPAMKGRLRIN